MGTIVYHEIEPTQLDEVLHVGVKRTMHSARSEEHFVKITNTFLDTHRPESIVKAQLSRLTNTYGYLGNNENLIDIASGATKRVAEFARQTSKLLLRMHVDPSRCYVGDLDLYDTLKRAMTLGEQDSTREHLARTYWDRLVRLDMFSPDLMKRPEILVTYDISPRSIRRVEG